MSKPQLTFELSDDDRRILREALGAYAWNYREKDPEVAACAESLAMQFEPLADDEPPTERKPTTISSVPPLFI